MSLDLEEEKKKVELQKKRLRLKEAFIREKEKQKRFKRVSEIVNLAFQANIMELDDATLLGAFLEIASHSNDVQKIESWKKNAALFEEAQQTTSNTLIAISFKSEPDKESKEKLKAWKFRWNSFRKEYCGYGNFNEIKASLKYADVKIELLS